MYICVCGCLFVSQGGRHWDHIWRRGIYREAGTGILTLAYIVGGGDGGRKVDTGILVIGYNVFFILLFNHELIRV